MPDVYMGQGDFDPGDLGRRVTQRVPDLRLRFRAADHHQSLHRPKVPLLVPGLHSGRLHDLDNPRTLLSWSDLQSLPGRGGLTRRPRIDATVVR